MKRFTETTKWDDPWYIDLTAEAKTLWCYLTDKCDNAGVIDLSHRQANFLLNGQVGTETLLSEIGDRVTMLKSGKIMVNGFVDFQFGELKEASNLHKNVIKLLKKHCLYDDEIKGSLTLDEGFGKAPSIGKGKGLSKGEGKGEEEPFNFKKSLLNYGFKESLVNDFMKIRKNKKATDTETAYNSLILEIEKTGREKDEVLRIIVERDWKGFKAEWLNKTDSDPTGRKQDKDITEFNYHG